MPSEKRKISHSKHEPIAGTAARPGGAMTDNPVTLRLPDALLERIEELLPHIATDLEFASMGSVSRSQVLRIAVFQGLNVLRRRYDLEAGREPEPE